MAKIQNLKLPASTTGSICCLTNPPLACLTVCLLHFTLLYFTSFHFTLFYCFAYLLKVLPLIFLTFLLPYFAFCFCFCFSTFILYLLCLSCIAYFLYTCTSSLTWLRLLFVLPHLLGYVYFALLIFCTSDFTLLSTSLTLLTLPFCLANFFEDSSNSI